MRRTITSHQLINGALMVPRDRLSRRAARGAGRLVAKGTWRGTRAVTRVGWRHRKMLAPLYTGCFLAAAAAVLHETTPDDGWKSVLSGAVAVGLWMGVRQYRRHKRNDPDWVKVVWYRWSLYLAAVTWMMLATIAGPSTIPLPGVLYVGYAAAQFLWWRYHRIRRDEVPTVDTLDIDPREDRWEEVFASEGGLMPGSVLIHLREFDNGWGAEVVGDPRKRHTTETIIALRGNIAAAYGVPARMVVVEPLITDENDRARILVLTHNPLQNKQMFIGPTLDPRTGQITIGIHADKTPAHYRLWIPDSGAAHGLVAGTTGAGKSGLLNQILAEIRHSGVACTMLADGQGGESVPDWVENVNCFAGTRSRIRRMLQGVERIADGRMTRQSRRRWVDEHGRHRRGTGKFTPTAENPLIAVVIDEAPLVMDDPEIARIVTKLTTTTRKTGIGVLLVVQVPSVAHLGGDITIKSMLSAMNVICFRTSDAYSGGMANPAGIQVDPAKLPGFWPDGTSTAGLGYSLTSQRVAEIRAKYVEDPYEWATSGELLPLPAGDLEDMLRGDDYYNQWMELLDVEDVEVEEAAATVTGAYANQQAQAVATNSDRILAWVRDHDGPHLTGVIATALDLPKGTVSQALGRWKKRGKVASTQRHGEWVYAATEDVAERERELVNA